MDFLDPQNKEFTSNTLRNGVGGDFWKIVQEALDKNIENLKTVFLSDINNGVYDVLPSEECKIAIYLFKEKLSHYELLKELPLNIIQEFSTLDQEQIEFDPYKKAKDFLPKKEK